MLHPREASKYATSNDQLDQIDSTCSDASSIPIHVSLPILASKKSPDSVNWESDSKNLTDNESVSEPKVNSQCFPLPRMDGESVHEPHLSSEHPHELHLHSGGILKPQLDDEGLSEVNDERVPEPQPVPNTQSLDLALNLSWSGSIRDEDFATELQFDGFSSTSTLVMSISDEERSRASKPKDDDEPNELDRHQIWVLSNHFDRIIRSTIIARSPANRATSAANRSVTGTTGGPQRKTEDPKRKGKNLSQGSEDQAGEQEDGEGDGEEVGYRPSASKRPKVRGFACPFYQRDKDESWPRVCTTAFEDVDRVKTHIVSHPGHKASELEYQTVSQHANSGSHLPETHSLSCNTRKRAVIKAITKDQRLRINQMSKKRSTAEQLTAIEKWKEMFRICFPGETLPSPFFGDPDNPLQGNYTESAEHSPFLNCRARFLKAVGSAFMTKTQYGINMPNTPDGMLKIIQKVVEDALDSLDLDLVKRCRPRVAGIVYGSASSDIPSSNHQNNDPIRLLGSYSDDVVDDPANMIDETSQSLFTDATHFSWANACPNTDCRTCEGDKASDDKIDSDEANSRCLDGVMAGSHASVSGVLDVDIPPDDVFSDCVFTSNDFGNMLHFFSEDDQGLL